MRDYDFKNMILRNKLRDVINSVYKSFGFFEMDTPALEKYEILTGKEVEAGEEIKKEIYQFKDNKGRHIGLRFDLTVPLMRYLGMNTNIKLPFKRQAYGKVWRYEDFKKGRYREFYQYDIDIVGSKSVYSDFECIWASSVVFEKLGLKVKYYINNRKLIEGILEYLGYKDKAVEIMRVIDKIRKFDKEKLLEELKGYGVDKKEGERILKIVNFSGDYNDLEEYVKRKEYRNDKIEEGLKSLKELTELLKGRKINYVIDFSVVRGLGYYTGNVFESFVDGYEGLGSVCSGGRYDGAGKYANRDLPSVGISIGVDRVMDVLKDKEEVVPERDFYVILVEKEGKEIRDYFMDIVSRLRKKYLVEYDLMEKSFSKNMKYASEMKYKYVIVLGEKEFKRGMVSLKNMESGEREDLNTKEFFEKFKV